MRVWSGLIVASMLVPFASAGSSAWVGTEELPELPAGGPVEYSSTYVGAHDHDYLHILAGWFDHDAASDLVTWHLKVEDATHLARGGSAGPAREIQCRVRGNITDDDGVRGVLQMDWDVHSNGTHESLVLFTSASSAITQGDVPIHHRLSESMEKPGYVGFSITREQLLLLGDAFRDPGGICYDYLTVQGCQCGSDINKDLAASKAEYSFKELQRMRGPDGRPDPVEAFERTNTSAPTGTTDTSAATRSPGAPAVLLLVGIACAAWVRRRAASP